jgi:predicted nucleic acid-binding protein
MTGLIVVLGSVWGCRLPRAGSALVNFDRSKAKLALGAPGVSGLRVVLDTNVLVSALLFEWPTVRELMRVLAYPKFHLSAVELEQLLADLLPWCETWSASIASADQQVRDPKDQIFVDLALTARVSALVSGDANLLALKDQFNPMKVLTPAEFHAVVHP